MQMIFWMKIRLLVVKTYNAPGYLIMNSVIFINNIPFYSLRHTLLPLTYLFLPLHLHLDLIITNFSTFICTFWYYVIHTIIHQFKLFQTPSA